ncbi:hypothetical protein LX32DRAFT_594851, partial [Colletotrichum zoysiae]
EALYERESWLCIGMAFRLGVTPAATNTLGPIAISPLVVDSKKVALVNISLRLVQPMLIFLPPYMAQRFCIKSPSLWIVFTPLLTGVVMLYVLGREHDFHCL